MGKPWEPERVRCQGAMVQVQQPEKHQAKFLEQGPGPQGHSVGFQGFKSNRKDTAKLVGGKIRTTY